MGASKGIFSLSQAFQERIHRRFGQLFSCFDGISAGYRGIKLVFKISLSQLLPSFSEIVKKIQE